MEGLRSKQTLSTVATSFSWPDPCAKSVFVVGNFDRFLRHELKRQENGAFYTVLNLPIGEYLYKYIVDGKYCVRGDLSPESILVDREGTRYIRLVVFRNPNAVRTNSSNSIEDQAHENHQQISPPSNEAPLAPSSQRDSRRSSRRERRSLLRRASDIFTKPGGSTRQKSTHSANLSAGTAPSNENEPTNAPTSSRQSWRKSVRSNRGSAVSAPVTVDAADITEVEGKVKQWREYAKTLQQWGDSDGAGVLYTQAINLMVEKGQVETRACAELHLDFAHVKSRLGDHVASETHVKQALQIYGACGFDRPERHGDLLSYLAVMVDRQKRRKEAEVYYQEALLMYKQHNVEGDNVTITAKNLRLNQKRQEKESIAQAKKDKGSAC